MYIQGFLLALHHRLKSANCYKQAHPDFVLTYLEELNEREEVTQMENCIHYGAWSAVHHEIDSSSAEEVTVSSHRQVLRKNVSNPNQKQLSGPLDAHLMLADPLGETTQLTVALVRKLEEKHPKASAQSLLSQETTGTEAQKSELEYEVYSCKRAVKQERIANPCQWKHSKVENPLQSKLTYLWPVLPDGGLGAVIVAQE